MGRFNEKCDVIILNVPHFYVWKCEEATKENTTIINECCFAISKDIKYVEDDYKFELVKMLKLKNK